MATIKRHLILDLDSTLIFSSSDMDAYRNLELYTNAHNIPLRERIFTIDLVDIGRLPGTGVKTKMWGVFRPHLSEFITFIASYFETINIWSAGQYKYVHAIADKIFRFTEVTPRVIFTFDDCVEKGDELYKPLSKMMERIPGMDPSNTYCLDDRPETFSKNKKNGIAIPAYEPASTYSDLMFDDIALVQLMSWFSIPRIVASEDIRNLNKAAIFTTSLTEYQKTLGSSYIPYTTEIVG